MTYIRRSRPRPPRSEELKILRSLQKGPRGFRDGPIGRCVKKGWCRPYPNGADMLFELTEDGIQAMLRTKSDRDLTT